MLHRFWRAAAARASRPVCTPPATHREGHLVRQAPAHRWCWRGSSRQPACRHRRLTRSAAWDEKAWGVARTHGGDPATSLDAVTTPSSGRASAALPLCHSSHPWHSPGPSWPCQPPTPQHGAPPAQWLPGSSQKLLPGRAAAATSAAPCPGRGSKPCRRQPLAQCLLEGCRQLKPVQPAGHVHSPVRALQVPT